MTEYEKSRFTLCEPLPGRRTALFNTLSRALGVMPMDVWTNILSGAETGNLAASLRDEGFLVEKGADETAVLTHFRMGQIYDTRHLKYYLTLNRNNGTPLLNGSEHADNRAMTMRTARRVLDFMLDDIEAKGPLDAALSFIGGEDGLNPSVLLYLAEGLSRFCRGRNLPLAISLNTGGQVLLTGLIGDLVPLGLTAVRAEIGSPPEVFYGDLNSRDHHSYYERLLDNLSAAAEAAPVEIMGVYGPFRDHYKKFMEILDELKARGLQDRVLTVSYGRDRPFYSPLGEVRPRPVMADCQLPDIKKRWLWLRRETEARGYTPHPGPPRGYCPAGRRDSLFIDEQGALVVCPALKGRGEYELGRVEKGIDFRREARALSRGLDNDCLTGCNLAPLCNGGCRWRAEADPAEDKGPDCRRDILEELIRAHVRRQALKNDENRPEDQAV